MGGHLSFFYICVIKTMAKGTLGVCGGGVEVIWLTLHHYGPLSTGQTLKAGPWRQQLSRGHGDALCINLSSMACSVSFLVPLRTNFPGWLNSELGPPTSILNQGNVLQICPLANPMEAISPLRVPPHRHAYVCHLPPLCRH